MGINTKKKFHSKILLFGEYTVILGSHALAVPYTKLSGNWDVNKKESNEVLVHLYQYLLSNHFEEQSAISVDLSKMNKALSKGIYFNSNIPIGYGVGSSGALSAAVLDLIKIGSGPYMLNELKSSLAFIESYFHGASSGLDPLVSWTNCAIEVISKNEIKEADQWKYPNSDFQLFLLDTGTRRSTSMYVEIFKEKVDNKKIPMEVLQQISELNNKAIKEFNTGNVESLYKLFGRVSRLQYEYFNEMIPENFLELWQNGLSDTDYKLKLCGAGGGGYLLGMARKNWLEKHNAPEIKVLH
jgi:mevalonate kinase